MRTWGSAMSRLKCDGFLRRRSERRRAGEAVPVPVAPSWSAALRSRGLNEVAW